MEPDPTNRRDEIARILDAINAGNAGAETRLMEVVLDELKRASAARLQRQADCSLSPTALVNEVYLKLFGRPEATAWSGPGHFFGAAAHAMKQILIDHARAKRRQKRGGDRLAVDLDLASLPKLDRLTVDELLELNDALDQLAGEDPALATLVELKFFVGQTTEQAAQTLGVSVRTANRHWQYAKARLQILLK